MRLGKMSPGARVNRKFQIADIKPEVYGGMLSANSQNLIHITCDFNLHETTLSLVTLSQFPVLDGMLIADGVPCKKRRLA